MALYWRWIPEINVRLPERFYEVYVFLWFSCNRLYWWFNTFWDIFPCKNTRKSRFVYVARFVYPASGSLILNFLNTNMMEMIFFSAFVQSELNLCRTSNIFQWRSFFYLWVFWKAVTFIIFTPPCRSWPFANNTLYKLVLFNPWCDQLVW